MSKPGTTLKVERHQWLSLAGTAVEVWVQGKLYREGLVDVVMPDGSAFWLAGDAQNSRQFILLTPGDEVRVSPPALM